MGAIAAVFKTDCAETRGAYSISEWWLEPRTQGPGAHRHREDDVFYILAGTMSVLWRRVARLRSRFLHPRPRRHHPRCRESGRGAGMRNVSAPGNSEVEIPAIADWFAERPPGRAG